MDNQHRKIRGYRELSQEEIDLMNEVKTKGLELEALIEKVQNHIASQRTPYVADSNPDEIDRLNGAEPERWAAMGKTNLQTGLMFLTRSIAQPDFF